MMTQGHRNRLRGLLESVKFKRETKKHLTIYHPELPSLEEALIAVLKEVQ